MRYLIYQIFAINAKRNLLVNYQIKSKSNQNIHRQITTKVVSRNFTYRVGLDQTLKFHPFKVRGKPSSNFCLLQCFTDISAFCSVKPCNGQKKSNPNPGPSLMPPPANKTAEKATTLQMKNRKQTGLVVGWEPKLGSK